MPGEGPGSIIDAGPGGTNMPDVAGEMCPATERPVLREAGSRFNPDGTPKNAADQMEQIENAQQRGREGQFDDEVEDGVEPQKPRPRVDNTGRSKTNLQKNLNNYDEDDWQN